MLTRTTSAAITGAALLIATLTACTATPDTASTSDMSPSPGSTSTNAPTIDPLSAYFWVDMSNFDEEMRQAEEIIKECMVAEGFEYTVVVYPSGNGEGFSLSPLGAQVSREWAADPENAAVNSEFLPRNYVPESETDPNEIYRKSLSAAEQEAYWRAYYGKARDGNPDDFTTDEKGCNGKATKFLSPYADQVRPPIIDAAEEFAQSLRTHPRIAALEKEVESCMADRGYAPGYDEAQYAKAQTYKNEHPDAVREDPGVAKLRDEEVKASLAAWDCRDKVGYFTRGITILAELEKDYIAEHKKELEEAQQWLNQ